MVGACRKEFGTATVPCWHAVGHAKKPDVACAFGYSLRSCGLQRDVCFVLMRCMFGRCSEVFGKRAQSNQLVHCVWSSTWLDNNQHVAGCVSQRPLLCVRAAFALWHADSCLCGFSSLFTKSLCSTRAAMARTCAVDQPTADCVYVHSRLCVVSNMLTVWIVLLLCGNVLGPALKTPISGDSTSTCTSARGCPAKGTVLIGLEC